MFQRLGSFFSHSHSFLHHFEHILNRNVFSSISTWVWLEQLDLREAIKIVAQVWRRNVKITFLFPSFRDETYGDDGECRFIRKLHSTIITFDNSPASLAPFLPSLTFRSRRITFSEGWDWIRRTKDSSVAKKGKKEYKWISYLFKQLFIGLKYTVANGTDRWWRKKSDP